MQIYLPYRRTADSVCFNFDGINKYMIKSIANYRSGDSGGTILASVKTTGTGTVFGTSDEATTDNFISLQVNNNVVGASVVYFATRKAGTFYIVKGSIPVNDGNRHMIAVTSDGVLWRIYVDAVLDSATVVLTSNTGDWFADFTGRDNITLGAYKATSVSDLYSGKAGEVAVFDTALSLAQLQAIYNGGTPQDISGHANLVNYWRNGVYPTIEDLAGSDDFTMTNMVAGDITTW